MAIKTPRAIPQNRHETEVSSLLSGQEQPAADPSEFLGNSDLSTAEVG